MPETTPDREPPTPPTEAAPDPTTGTADTGPPSETGPTTEPQQPTGPRPDTTDEPADAAPSSPPGQVEAGTTSPGEQATSPIPIGDQPVPSFPTTTVPTPAADAGLPRRHSVPLVLTAIAAILIGLIFADGTDAEQTDEDTPALPQQEQVPVPEPASTSSDGGELTIVDSGWSVFDDLSDDTLVSWAVVVTNTSEEMAVSGGVTLTAAGEDVTFYGDAISAAIPTLLPGDSITIGDTAYPDDAEVDDLDFELHNLQWWQPDDSMKPVEALRASEIEVGWINEGETDPYWTSDGIEAHVDEDGDMVVRFRVDSAYQEILGSPAAMAVFRDSDGTLLGATDPLDFDVWAEFPPGWSVQTLFVKYGPPEGTDDDKVEIQLYPGGGW